LAGGRGRARLGSMRGGGNAFRVLRLAQPLFDELRCPGPPALAADITRLETLWTDGLNRFGGPFLAGGTFTGVDAFFAPVAFRIQTYGISLAPVAAAYASRLLKLRSMQEWYAAGIAERFRDEPHDQEILQAGSVIQDLRAPPLPA
jgi:glutathione S-transferase